MKHLSYEELLAELPEHWRHDLTSEDLGTLEELWGVLPNLPPEFLCTTPDASPQVATLASDALARVREQLWIYMACILSRGHHLNLTTIVDAKGMYQRHILDALALLPVLPSRSQATVLDVGTGAGLPGLILAMARPDLDVVLNDALQKRLVFIQEVIDLLALKNVSIVHARAEDLGRNPQWRDRVDVVVARAVAALPVLAEYCLPLVKPGGIWVAPKTDREAPESMAYALSELKGQIDSTYTPIFDQEEACDASEHRFVVYVVKKLANTPRRYPRKAGIPAKKPLK